MLNELLPVHLYDDNGGVLYLADGKSIPVDPHQFSSVLEAQRILTEWAKRLKIIGEDESIATFS